MQRLADSSHVFLMGIGDAYGGLVELLSNNGKHYSHPPAQAQTKSAHRPENTTGKVTYVISFVAENSLQAVTRPTDDSVSGWYYQVSIKPEVPVKQTLCLNMFHLSPQSRHCPGSNVEAALPRFCGRKPRRLGSGAAPET